MSDSDFEAHVQAALEVYPDRQLIEDVVSDIRRLGEHNDPQRTKRVFQKHLERQENGTPLLLF
jgi:hypothetical protein